MKNTVLLITANGMGKAEPELQLMLMGKYLELLSQLHALPAAICFYTDGVKLVCEGSPFVERLQDLEAKGVRLIVCSTCLAYFKLTDKVKVGIVGGMGDIITAQANAAKVISL